MRMSLAALFSAALKHYRERAGVSQEELAAAAGLDRSYISQLERGLKSPTLTTLEKLASRLDVKPELLLQRPRGNAPRFPDDYHVREQRRILVSRGRLRGDLPTDTITGAVNVAHELIDDLYAVDLDVAAVLGLRNLSAFIGELLAAAMVQVADGYLQAEPASGWLPRPAPARRAWSSSLGPAPEPNRREGTLQPISGRWDRSEGHMRQCAIACGVPAARHRNGPTWAIRESIR